MLKSSPSAKGVAVTLALISGFGAGWQARGMWAHRAVAQQQAAVVKTVESQNAVTYDAETEHLEAQERQRVITREIVREVKTYVTPEVVDRCPIPNGLVGLHDAAAQGVPPVPTSPGVDHAAPSGHGFDEWVEVQLGNYGIAHEWRTQLEACQKWINDQFLLSSPSSPSLLPDAPTQSDPR